MKNLKLRSETLSREHRDELLRVLKTRFEKNLKRHPGLAWSEIKARLEAHPQKLWSLHEMERTDGEPDVVGQDPTTGECIFFDCSPESPSGRTSICYDREGLDSRKEHKPKTTAVDLAAAMGIELLTEQHYRDLQQLGDFDTKSSSWVKTPRRIFENSAALSLVIAASAMSSYIITVPSLTIAAEASAAHCGCRAPLMSLRKYIGPNGATRWRACITRLANFFVPYPHRVPTQSARR